jgi:hypothetical protein
MAWKLQPGYSVFGIFLLLLMNKGISLRDDLDDCNLKLTFRRTIDSNTMNLWYKLLQIAISGQFI